MSQPHESRIALAMIFTALVMSAIWILSDSPLDIADAGDPVWRYTNEGWKELSELTPPPQESAPGPVDNVAPLVWGAIQLLAGLAILIGFAEEPPTHREVSAQSTDT